MGPKQTTFYLPAMRPLVGPGKPQRLRTTAFARPHRSFTALGDDDGYLLGKKFWKQKTFKKGLRIGAAVVGTVAAGMFAPYLLPMVAGGAAKFLTKAKPVVGAAGELLQTLPPQLFQPRPAPEAPGAAYAPTPVYIPPSAPALPSAPTPSFGPPGSVERMLPDTAAQLMPPVQAEMLGGLPGGPALWIAGGLATLLVLFTPRRR